MRFPPPCSNCDDYMSKPVKAHNEKGELIETNSFCSPECFVESEGIEIGESEHNIARSLDEQLTEIED